MKVQVFDIAPRIPPALQFLQELANNMWWCWQPEAIALFQRISPQLWREVQHSPVEFLTRLPQGRLEALAVDEGFIHHLQSVEKLFRNTGTCTKEQDEGKKDGLTAYFSLEFGIHESLRIYSGGLGVLAGDHLKAASDCGAPLVAVGLLYRQGFFQQYLNDDGWQQEHYPENEMHFLPYQRVFNEDGTPLEISIPLPDGTLHAALWRLNVGRIALYLLDANIPENPTHLRETTAQLYGGDARNRLHQELLLGVGGFQALMKLGFNIKACHINEGHAAFLSLARISHLMTQQGLDIDTALETVTRTNIFTTHTPVPAGNETFQLSLVRPYLDALEKVLSIPAATVVGWGQRPGADAHEDLSMTILGLRLSRYSNGVSKLHGKIAREMWQHLWPQHPEDEVPIKHVTNGIHVPSFISPDLVLLFNRYLGTDWQQHPGDPSLMKQLAQIPDEELWRAHELGRSRLIRKAREWTERQYSARNATKAQLTQIKSILDHDALTIGFARRFATYKRATLLLKDEARLRNILLNEERPVQIIFAGKAHPADDQGKDLIRRLIHFARQAGVRRRLVFLENYNLEIARALVQGVDVWLNTPRRPLEASGTSGMKAAANGALNLSILDGWWCEGYTPERGWAIGRGEDYEDTAYQDSVESHALYNLLEDEVIPCFYDREMGDIPANWVKMLRDSIAMTLSFFTSHRMLQQYEHEYYDPSRLEYDRLLADTGAAAKQLSQHRARLREHWDQVQIKSLSFDRNDAGLHVGETFTVLAHLATGALKPDELQVQVYFGPIDSQNKITASHCEDMGAPKETSEGVFIYEHTVTCDKAGRYGVTARVIPHGKAWDHLMPGFVTWADPT